MTSQYFQAITQTTWFQPAKAKNIKNISPEEQFDGLERLLYDAAGAYYHNDDYYFYVYWTGFLYALSRSDIIGIIKAIQNGFISNTHSPMRHMLMALLGSFIFGFFYKYINAIQKDPQLMRSPFFNHLIKTLLSRGYDHAKNKKQMIIDVLSEMVRDHHDSISGLEDLIRLILEIMTNPLIKIFGLIQHK